jgi:hypothetical protein
MLTGSSLYPTMMKCTKARPTAASLFAKGQHWRVDERVRFRLCAGRYADDVVRAVLNTATEIKLKVEYGRRPSVAKINLDPLTPQRARINESAIARSEAVGSY